MAKKRPIDESVKACSAARKKNDTNYKTLEKSLKGLTAKTKAKAEDALNKCQESYAQLKPLMHELEALEDDNEKDFETKKKAETELCNKSLQFLAEQLITALKAEELSDESKETIQDLLADIKKLSKKNGKSDEISEEIEDDDEEEEEEDEEEEDDDVGTSHQYADPTKTDKEKGSEHMGKFVAIDSFTSKQEGHLNFSKMEQLTILFQREDGWWMAINSKGERGLVPSNYLESAGDEYEDDDEYESSEEEGEEEEEDEEEDEADVTKGSSRDASLSEKQDKEDSEKPTSTSSLKAKGWSALRKDLNKTTEADVIAALGGGPTGFRASTTAAMLLKPNSPHSYVSVLHPRISDSGFQLKDLFWTSKGGGGLKPREMRALRNFRLTMARNVPTPSPSVEVLCRYVCIALFDGKSILSNIMTVKATWAESDPKTWRFTPKTSGLVPTLLDGFGMLRYPSYIQDLGLLIELNVAYLRKKSGEKGHLSCGHVHLKLCTDYGSSLPIGNKEFELDLAGGTPFEKDVPLDPAVTGQQTGPGSTTGLKSLISSKKQATLTVKVGELNKEERVLASYLPDSIVMPVTALQMAVYYRQILAQELLGGTKTTHKIRTISSPFLANFPIAMDTPDLMDFLRNEWSEVFKNMKRNEKKDPVHLRDSFKSLFLQTVYPIMYSYALPKFSLHDQEAQSERWRLIKELVAETKKSPLALLTSSNMQYRPFLMQETKVDIMNAFLASEVLTA